MQGCLQIDPQRRKSIDELFQMDLIKMYENRQLDKEYDKDATMMEDDSVSFQLKIVSVLH